MSLWIYNDVELDIDMSDVEFQEKYENAFNKMAKTEASIQKIGKLSDITRAYCNMFYTLYDDIFGEGTGTRLMGEKRNMDTANECYASFLDVCKKDIEETNKKLMHIGTKYSPKKRK